MNKANRQQTQPTNTSANEAGDQKQKTDSIKSIKNIPLAQFSPSKIGKDEVRNLNAMQIKEHSKSDD